MSDPKDPIDPKEATEAKLCAYLEGELGPAERAEIEQHLLANPQHRQLLADLAQTREWMRAIPPETSPVDLAEIFQGQVERSMLLDDAQGVSSRWLASWPQFAMVAAVLLLMLGLGALLFAMLRGPAGNVSGTSGKVFSLAPSITGSPATQSLDHPVTPALPTFSAKTVDLSGVPSATAVAIPPETASASKALPEPADAAGRYAAKPGGGFDGAISESETVKEKLAGFGYHPPADQKTICFVVSADAPEHSAEQLRAFFQRHQLAFDDVTNDPREPTLALGNLDQLAATTVTTQPIDVTKDKTVSFDVQKSQTQQQQSAANQNFNNSGEQSAQNAPPPVRLVIPPAHPAALLYSARGLTSLQLELLAASLETDNLNPSVQRVALSEGPTIPASTEPVANAVARGQTLTITVAQLVGPGIDKTNVVKVTDDGTIALPMIDPLPVTGLSPAQIERRIAGKYREMNLIPQATVTVVASSPATTQSAAAVPATTMPTTQTVFAATLPAAPSAPPPAGIDVIVLIEKTPPSPPGK
jgi:hypothetical protein